MKSLWVAVLHISDRTAEKINGHHGLTAREVRDAVLCREGLAYTWEDHETRGLRAKVKVVIRGVDVLVVLYPDRNDPFQETFNLGSAYPR